MYANDEVDSAAAPPALTPAKSPPTQTQTATDGTATASDIYNLTDAFLNIDMSQSRPGTLRSYGQSDGYVDFTVDTSATYTASGTFAAADVGSPPSSGRVRLEAHLSDLTTSGDLFNSVQESRDTPNEQFTLGGSSGDLTNTFDGSLTGSLLPGHTYRFYHATYIWAYPDADSGASSLGNVKLQIAYDDAVAAAPLPAVLPSGLALMAFVVVRQRKHRKRNQEI